MRLRHARFCTNDYNFFSNGRVERTSRLRVKAGLSRPKKVALRAKAGLSRPQ